MLCCRLEKEIMLVIGVVHISWVSDLDLTDFNAGQWRLGLDCEEVAKEIVSLCSSVEWWNLICFEVLGRYPRDLVCWWWKHMISSIQWC